MMVMGLELTPVRCHHPLLQSVLLIVLFSSTPLFVSPFPALVWFPLFPIHSFFSFCCFFPLYHVSDLVS